VHEYAARRRLTHDRNCCARQPDGRARCIPLETPAPVAGHETEVDVLGNLFAFGIPAFFLLLFALVIVSTVIVVRMLSVRARAFGYPSRGAYLRAAPRTDAEKRDAVDLTLRGIALCVLGGLFAPFVLVGLIPLFYGGRKVAYASMGLGLVDDPDQPHA
jgi:hypothetical protein